MLKSGQLNQNFTAMRFAHNARFLVISLAAAVFAVAMFLNNSAVAASPSAMIAQASTAEAIVKSTAEPSEVLGEATFTETTDGLEVAVSLSGVTAGYHGFHVHENGSCADGGQAAGGHYNPMAVKHGWLPSDGLDTAHAGDLGNIFISSSGSGTLKETLPGLSLANGEPAVSGLAVILHADRDDFGQPTGNAGGRAGCGIIE
ncbi:MAG: superoxide dismutase family protein [Elainellaceae cyanobacterium]